MIRTLILGTLLSLGLFMAAAEGGEVGTLNDLLASEAAAYPGKLTIYVKQLSTGVESSVAPDQTMQSMSIIKLGLLAKTYRMAEQDRLALDDRVVLGAKDLRGGTGVLQYHAPGMTPTYRDLLWEMVITSHNTATDALLERTGGVDELNRWLSASGFGAMRMQSTLENNFARVARIVNRGADPLSDQEINAVLVGQRSYELSPAGLTLANELGKMESWLGICDRFTDPSTWLGATSARAVGRMLEQMETGTIASKTHSAEMVEMLKGQQAGARRIPMYLDTRYVIGHKTGDFPPCVANDAGIVYLDSGPTVMVFLADQIRGNYGEAEARIGQIARRVAEYFDGK